MRRNAYTEIQERAMLPLRTILHPTDFSNYSNYAFRLACSLARDYGARLVVLHVAQPPTVVVGEGVMPLPTAIDQERLQEQPHQLRPVDLTMRVEHRLVGGDAAIEVLRVGEEIKCDLIVLGTHGRTGLSRLLMGSVAEQIVRKASCPVLTVKTSLRKVPSPEETITDGQEAAAVK
jgi:nucleotide-binding universal stress UspA family protein